LGKLSDRKNDKQLAQIVDLIEGYKDLEILGMDTVTKMPIKPTVEWFKTHNLGEFILRGANYIGTKNLANGGLVGYAGGGRVKKDGGPNPLLDPMGWIQGLINGTYAGGGNPSAYLDATASKTIKTGAKATSNLYKDYIFDPSSPTDYAFAAVPEVKWIKTGIKALRDAGTISKTAKVVNPSGVSRYLGTVKNISDNTMGGIKKYLGMTPNQEKYMWRQWEINPENADLYFNKFKSRARIPVGLGPGRGIGKISYDAVEQLAKESGIVLKPGTFNVYGKLIEKLGLQYRPSDNQFLKDLVHTILPNAQGQSKLEIQRLNQLRKLVKPYEKDLSKMPGGIRAALEDMFAIHRSNWKNQKGVPANKVESQFNMFGNGPLEGPGLYTAGTLKISDQSWADYSGQYLYRQLYSPEAWKQVLKSKGYATDEIIAKTIESNPNLLKNYNYLIDKSYGYTSVNLEGLKVSDKLIKHLMNEGYIGYRSSPTVKTNWRIGEPGFGLEPFNPNPNGILGYAIGGLVSSMMPKSEPIPAQFANGGMVIPRFKTGGYVGVLPRYADGGLANLHQGEYVLQKSAVDRIGLNNLNSINQGETSMGDCVYNYNINLNVSSVSDPNQIADTVLGQIRRLDNQRIRGNRV